MTGTAAGSPGGAGAPGCGGPHGGGHHGVSAGPVDGEGLPGAPDGGGGGLVGAFLMTLFGGWMAHRVTDRRHLVLGLAGGLMLGTLRAAGLGAAEVTALATLDVKAAEPGVVAAAARLGVPVTAYTSARLAAVPGAGGSAAVLAAVGTPSVAEAAALAGGGELVVRKRTSRPVGRPAGVTCAIARRVAGGPGASAATGRQTE
ncbi:cobalamin biosynthesis protein [Streptomyces sp. t39]|uniref:cobalamin biosynthesis protein n=1 Tax=Streptomyces sp. t39 TaxID=1828156 RepID=UPI0029058D61|nr:cobalamin biosynthesis protein [Streptomyces sp. t39]